MVFLNKIKVVIAIISIIAIFLIIRKLKKRTNKREYLDKTTKQYKRWHK